MFFDNDIISFAIINLMIIFTYEKRVIYQEVNYINSQRLELFKVIRIDGN